MPDEGRLGKPCERGSVAFLEARSLASEAPNRTLDTLWTPFLEHRTC
jgi:hypothetical protein